MMQELELAYLRGWMDGERQGRQRAIAHEYSLVHDADQREAESMRLLDDANAEARDDDTPDAQTMASRDYHHAVLGHHDIGRGTRN